MAPSQHYVSNELTHFVGRSFREDPDRYERQYGLLKEIIESGTLKARKIGSNNVVAMSVKDQLRKPLSSNEAYYPYCVCFCDIPEESFGIHMSNYSQFGLSFPKHCLVKKGAHPVFYIPNNSRPSLPNSLYEFLGEPVNLADGLNSFWDAYWRLQDLTWSRDGMGDEARKLLEMIAIFLDFNVFSYFKFFDDNLLDDHEENFYMEREWRVLGPVSFTLNEIHSVVLPKAFEMRFREDVPKYKGKVTCPDREIN